MSFNRVLLALLLAFVLGGCATVDRIDELDCPEVSNKDGDETDGGVGGTGKLPDRCRNGGD